MCEQLAALAKAFGRELDIYRCALRLIPPAVMNECRAQKNYF
jgi:hypothetical protein